LFRLDFEIVRAPLSEESCQLVQKQILRSAQDDNSALAIAMDDHAASARDRGLKRSPREMH
jgi:hypothetical protein